MHDNIHTLRYTRYILCRGVLHVAVVVSEGEGGRNATRQNRCREVLRGGGGGGGGGGGRAQKTS